MTNKTPFASHLGELRRRLVWVVGFFVASSGLCFYFATELFAFLAAPLREVLGSEGLIYTSITEVFIVHLKLALLAGAVFSFPFMAWQLWAFLEPGLYRKEKPATRKFLLLIAPFFTLGMAFCYWVVLPNAWRFFITFSEPITPMPKAGEYFSLTLRLLFAFGAAFLLPPVLLLLGKVGLITPAALKKHRRYAVVAAFLAAAVLTPPDVTSQILLALPILLLYEFSILLLRK